MAYVRFLEYVEQGERRNPYFLPITFKNSRQMEKEFEKVAEATMETEEKASVADYEGIKVGKITARYLHLLYVTLPMVYDEFLEILEDEFTTDGVDKMMTDFCDNQYVPMKEYLVNNGLMNHFDDVANNLGKIEEL